MQAQPSRENGVFSDFSKTENKAKLWKLLQDNGAFHGIDSNYFKKVREDFEITIVKVENQFRDKPLMAKNKFFLDSMLNIVKQYKHQPIYTAQDLQKTRMDAFDNDLSKKQAEFDRFNAKPKPPQVDFSDKEGENVGDVNALLEKAMRDREAIASQVLPPLPQAKEATPIAQLSQPEQLNRSPNPVKSEGEERKVIDSSNEMLKLILSKLEIIETLLKGKENEKDGV